MVLRNSDNSPIEIFERLIGKSVDLHGNGSEAWWETVTQHLPETPPATRLALQARITALDLAQDEAVLELTQDEAA